MVWVRTHLLKLESGPITPSPNFLQKFLLWLSPFRHHLLLIILSFLTEETSKLCSTQEHWNLQSNDPKVKWTSPNGTSWGGNTNSLLDFLMFVPLLYLSTGNSRESKNTNIWGFNSLLCPDSCLRRSLHPSWNASVFTCSAALPLGNWKEWGRFGFADKLWVWW